MVQTAKAKILFSIIKMADIPLQVDGDDTFVLGMDSYTMPSKLMPGEYELSMNTINRGGLIQTRPGSRPVGFTPIGSINKQGITFFTPSSGRPALVYVNDGIPYASFAPFDQSFRIPNIELSPNSRFVSWASCVQTTYINTDGDIEFLETPRNILIMQDGASRAAYWDGTSSGQLNPLLNETPVGLWMAWSNNRLWVTSGTQVFASDIGNPLSFTEDDYLNEGRSFYLPDECTGVTETPDRLGVIFFTRNTTTLLQSSIQDRTLWLETPQFQQTLLTNVGCIAPRSIVTQYGMIWWFSARGLISLDDSLKSHISSRLEVRDNEMFQSKYAIDPDMSGACGATFENFLLHAVPYGGKLNSRIHVLDQAPFETNSPNSWSSYWMGWRPVEFATGIVDGIDRIFCMSIDYDGSPTAVGRVWELFASVKTDGGIPITSYVITRQNLFGNRDYKTFKYAEVELRGISGPTAITIGVKGLRGAFQKIATKDLSAINGQVYHDGHYGHLAADIAGSRTQTRIVRTVDMPGPSDCNSECVESNIRGLHDKGFSLLIAWCGIAGVSAYRMFCQTYPQAYQGVCENDETGEERLINQNGCAAIGLFSTSDSFETFWATATYSVIYVINEISFEISFTMSASSKISQEDANRNALAKSVFRANRQIQEIYQFYQNFTP